MFRHIFQNIYTTIAGTFTGLPVLVEGIRTGDRNSIILGAGTLLLGLLAKDGSNK